MLNFPPSPQINDIYSLGNRSWMFNGTAWSIITTFSAFTGVIDSGELVPSNLLLTESGDYLITESGLYIGL